MTVAVAMATVAVAIADTAITPMRAVAVTITHTVPRIVVTVMTTTIVSASIADADATMAAIATMATVIAAMATVASIATLGLGISRGYENHGASRQQQKSKSFHGLSLQEYGEQKRGAPKIKPFRCISTYDSTRHAII